MARANVQVAKESLVVVYDQKSGQIVHGHHFVTFKGGRHPGEKEQEGQALEECSLQRRGAAGKMAVLHVAMSDVESGMDYRVDPTKRMLVEDRKKQRKR